MKSRGEQLIWAKQRALFCVDMGHFSDAVAGLRTGSANFSRSGETRQDNDLVALRGSSVCAGFDAKFGRAWGS